MHLFFDQRVSICVHAWMEEKNNPKKIRAKKAFWLEIKKVEKKPKKIKKDDKWDGENFYKIKSES